MLAYPPCEWVSSSAELTRGCCRCAGAARPGTAHCAAPPAADEPGSAAAPAAGQPCFPGRLAAEISPEAHSQPNAVTSRTFSAMVTLGCGFVAHLLICFLCIPGEGQRPLGPAIAVGGARFAGPGAGRPRAPLAAPAAAGCAARRRRGVSFDEAHSTCCVTGGIPCACWQQHWQWWHNAAVRQVNGAEHVQEP
jgi:hypothetical protein